VSSERAGVKAIFDEAAEIASPEGRAAYLDRACGGDASLRHKVDALLEFLDGAGSYLESPAAIDLTSDQVTDPASGHALGAMGPTPSGNPPAIADATAGGTVTVEPSGSRRPSHNAQQLVDGPGSLIGSYQLLQKLGEGGMGAVYLAEQEKPVRRRVALKVVKPGMDTEQIVARFEAERQALAMMDHPGIAKVLDAGATDSGRPYFVMELVKGVSITDYCDAIHLTPKERLELFVPICAAVQHAHQKGIIHRDIKPSNVLITMQDGKPVPKVIDFGIAKAIDQKLTEKTFFTQHGAIVGTLEYMSPEQAEISTMDVDTRTDIYALGVLLYELLTGSTPLERARLRTAAYSEILRRIREEEPPKPSTRLSESKADPARLTKLVRGDLDWIVMKAIEKDRTRRYESASGFARDVERYLEGDPVEAGPPAAMYRIGKYARKNRAALLTVCAFVTMLAAAAVTSAVLAVRATRAEHQANLRLDEVNRANAATLDALTETTKAKEATDAALKQSEEARTQAEAVSKFLVEAFRKPDPSQDGRTLKVVDLLDGALAKLDTEFTASPLINAEIRGPKNN
jgi:tRNA A-37 threonylcarbamoyl transferase component Bud32